MQRIVHQDILALDIDEVTKIYTQWQRSGKATDIIKNLFCPEKKEIMALDHLSFQVRQGEFLAYAGANGAGKSTTIKILSGILQPNTGTVRVQGVNPAKERVKLMRQIGVLFGQRTELWWDQPVISSFQWKKSVWNISNKVFERNLALVTELLDLGEILKTFARELSLGQRMRADLGMLLLHEPQLIFLDEPTLGLDVLAKQQMIRFLKRINEENGTTIVVTSHDMDDLEEMAKRIILLSKGQIAFDGKFDELRMIKGGFSRISVTASGNPPVLPHLRLISTENNVHEYEFNREEIQINEILGSFANCYHVTDVEIKKAPIEEIISNLYMEWAQN